MRTYGLLGKELSHSFSKQHFTQKFEKENIDAVYENFSLRGISIFPQFIENHQEIDGLSVTIPYKRSVIYFIDELDSEAEAIGAVNVVKIYKDSDRIRLKGYNTDVYGFETSLRPLLRSDISKALVLGAGGAALAVAFVLKKLGIDYTFVSRNPQEGMINYSELTKETVSQNKLIINASPLGTAGERYENDLLFPTQLLSEHHVCYDLVYNPEKTRFLAEAEQQSAVIKNGYEMLVLQAERAWAIWNE